MLSVVSMMPVHRVVHVVVLVMLVMSVVRRRRVVWFMVLVVDLVMDLLLDVHVLGFGDVVVEVVLLLLDHDGDVLDVVVVQVFLDRDDFRVVVMMFGVVMFVVGIVMLLVVLMVVRVVVRVVVIAGLVVGLGLAVRHQDVGRMVLVVLVVPVAGDLTHDVTQDAARAFAVLLFPFLATAVVDLFILAVILIRRLADRPVV